MTSAARSRAIACRAAGKQGAKIKKKLEIDPIQAETVTAQDKHNEYRRRLYYDRAASDRR